MRRSIWICQITSELSILNHWYSDCITVWCTFNYIENDGKLELCSFYPSNGFLVKFVICLVVNQMVKYFKCFCFFLLEVFHFSMHEFSRHILFHIIQAVLPNHLKLVILAMYPSYFVLFPTELLFCVYDISECILHSTRFEREKFGWRKKAHTVLSER